MHKRCNEFFYLLEKEQRCQMKLVPSWYSEACVNGEGCKNEPQTADCFFFLYPQAMYFGLSWAGVSLVFAIPLFDFQFIFHVSVLIMFSLVPPFQFHFVSVILENSVNLCRHKQMQAMYATSL